MFEERVGFRDSAGKLSITKDQLVREIVSVAENELAFWSRDGNPLTDRSPDGAERITAYLTYLWDGSVPTMPKTGGGRRDFHPTQDAWSAVFVCYCVTYAFEKHFGRVDDRAALRKRVPLSRELMHFQYAKAALAKRDASNRGQRGATGYYWAFDSGLAVEPGDIVLKDRRALTPGMANLQFADLRTLSWQSTHADIVTRVEGDTAVLVGGNLGDSVKETRYPLKDGLIDRRQRRNAANRVFCELRLVPQTDVVASSGLEHVVAATGVKQLPPIAASDGERRMVVLVPGTTDPLNTSLRSASGEAYWDEPFLTSLEKLCSPMPRCELITGFAWSGKNNLEERKKAGESLWEYIRGLSLEPEDPTSLHLIGHSHGGNVINEFTKASATTMPDEWRIGSITYLSTPFIPAHAPVLTRFSDDAVVLNVANSYDLTQRVIADFTLAHGPPVRRLYKDSGLEAAIAGTRWPDPAELVIVSDSSDGVRIWEEWSALLDVNMPRIAAGIEQFVSLLNTGHPELLDPDAVMIIRSLVAQLREWSAVATKRLDKRVSEWKQASVLSRARRNWFSASSFMSDVSPGLLETIDHFTLALGTKKPIVDSPLLGTVAGLVINSLALFSDTRSDPSELYPRDGKRVRILQIGIGKYDPYDGSRRRDRYEAFARDLEALQQRFADSPRDEQERLVREALLLLVAQMHFEGPLKGLRAHVLKVSLVSRGIVESQLRDLASDLATFTRELSSRRRNLLEDRLESLEPVLSGGSLTYVRQAPSFVDLHAHGLGDIVRYFVHTAHNLSRSTLFPDVESSLREALR